MIYSDFLKKKKAKRIRVKNKTLYFRWLFIVSMIPIVCLASKSIVSMQLFFETLGITAIYNIIVSFYFLRSKKKNRGLSDFIIFVDIIILSVFIYQSGGIYADLFLYYFFIMCYYGIRSGSAKLFKLAVLIISIYSVSSVFAGLSRNFIDFNVWVLIIRDILILPAAYGISLITSEVKRYDEMHKREFKMARTDKLTGLANRHYLEQKLTEELHYADSHGKPLNVIIFDLDNFKKFNDSYGHIWGDKLLTIFADIIKQNTRRSDIPIRFGGEEFLILIRDLDLVVAKSVGERIRMQLEKQRIYMGSEDNKVKVTVSCGIAQYPKHSNEIKQVIDLADKALYHAKEIGKNIVVTYDDIFIDNEKVE